MSRPIVLYLRLALRLATAAAIAALAAPLGAFAQSPTTHVDTGGHHTCALGPGGGVTCWGRGTDGQLGNGSNTNSGTPVDVTGLSSGVASVVTGGDHTCALTTTGTVKCWGLNGNGQLGQSGGNRNTPGDVPGLANVVSIVTGEFHGCALTAAGGVKCWGNNFLGQLGDPSAGNNRITPGDVPGLTSGVKAIASGDSHVCVLLTDGTAKCWGHNENGQVGNGTLADNGAQNQIGSPVAVAGLTGTISKISTGRYHTCALKSDGSVHCWGKNGAGQIGDGTTSADRLSPTPVSGLASGVADIEAGFDHSCAVLTSGEARCWGRNDKGQLGNGAATGLGLGVTTPVAVHGLASGAALPAAGFEHTCWLTRGGSIRCHGVNSDGRVGDGTTGGSDVLNARNVVNHTAGVAASQVAAGGQHGCQLDASGTVRCWGRNTEGQLGDATNTSSSAPVLVSGLSGATSVATGSLHTCAVVAGGAKCWGSNSDGQLGSSGGSQNTPTDVTGLTSGVAAVVTGELFGCALTTGGAVKCWGANDRGQLGNSTNTGGSAPVDVTGLSSGVVAITARHAHACALLSGGAAKCWGWNLGGQLGNGTLASNGLNNGINAPVDVNLSNIEAIAAGGEFTCAIVTGGGAKCWGHGDLGQLGNDPNDYADSLTPLDVTGLTSGVSQIAAGFAHACARTTAGAAKCWGANDAGQLGRGTVDVSGFDTPQSVLGLATDATAISAGVSHTCALVTGGYARCWGANGSGRLGDGTSTDRSSPAEVATRQQWLTFAPPTPIKVGAATTLSATASSGLAAAFDTWTSATCGISGSTVTATNVGLCAVRASQPGNGSYLAAPQQSRILVVIKGDQVITFNALPGRTFNDAAFDVASFATSASPNSGNPVTFSSQTPGVCTTGGTNGSTVTIVASGTCTLAADQAQTANWNAAPQQLQSFTVAKANQAITFNALPDKAFGAASFDVSSAASSALPNSGNPITFASTTPGVCTTGGTNGATVSIVAVGTCTLTADQAGNGNYDAAPQQSRSFAVNKAAQAITFGALADRTFGDAPFGVSATGGASGNPVTFTSLTTGVCTTGGANGATVTIVAGGTCTIAADQAGNASYEAAAQVTRSFTVNKANQAITFGALAGKTFNDPPFAVSATASPSGLTVAFTSQTTSVCTVSGTTVTLVGAGTCTIAANQPGNGNYNAAPQVTQGFNVAKADQAITFGALADKVFTDAPFAVSATAGSGLAVAFSTTTTSVCSISGTTVTLVGAGTCTIDANQAGNANYNAAPPVTRSFTVAKANQAITFNPLANRPRSDPPFTVSATASSGLGVAFSSSTTGVCTVSGTTVTLVSVGTCTLAADQAGNANYNAAPQVARTFTVLASAPTAPVIGTATRGNAQASISFSAPATDGGSAITSYTATCNPGAISASAAASPILVNGLANGTTYACSVTATNAIGTGPASGSASVTPSTVPGAPTIGAATAGNGQATISFSSPASDGGSPLTGFQVTCNPGGFTASGGATPITVTGLANGTAYACSVQALNANGASAASASVNVTPVAPAIGINPSSIAFGGQSMGTTSPIQSITVTNTGTSTLTIASVSSTNAQFEQAHDCTSLAPNASCTIAVEFSPAATTDALNASIPVSGTLSITTNAAGSPHTVPLGGTAEKSLVTHYYRSILRRAPDAGGKAFWSNEAARVAGTLGANVNEVWFAMAQQFYSSGEYAAFNRDNAGFVTDLYNTFFNRPPDSGGLGFWVNNLNSGMPREVALAEFMFSAEFAAFTRNIFGTASTRAEMNAVMDFYRALLSRLPDNGGFNFWVGRFRAAQCQGATAIVNEVEAISSAFTLSGEYAGRNRSTAQYVGDLYNAFLRRGGDLGGVQFWINQIASGARTRENVRIEFKNSAEFQARVQAIIQQGCLS